MRSSEFDNEEVDYSTVLEGLDSSRIFSIVKLKNGNFKFIEECDCYFSAELTKEEMKTLIKELQKLIED